MSAVATATTTASVHTPPLAIRMSRLCPHIGKITDYIAQQLKENDDRHNTLAVIMYGSHAYGKPTIASDLDIIHIIRDGTYSFEETLRDTFLVTELAKKANKTQRLDVITESITNVRNLADLYGDVFYDALRRGLLVYAHSDYKGVPIDVHVDLRAQARMLLGRIELQMSESHKYLDSRFINSGTGTITFAHIFTMLRVLLLYEGIRHPLKKDIRLIYEWLPPQYRQMIEPVNLDFERIQRFLDVHNRKFFSKRHLQYGIDMSEKLLEIVKKTVM